MREGEIRSERVMDNRVWGNKAEIDEIWGGGLQKPSIWKCPGIYEGDTSENL